MCKAANLFMLKRYFLIHIRVSGYPVISSTAWIACKKYSMSLVSPGVEAIFPRTTNDNSVVSITVGVADIIFQ